MENMANIFSNNCGIFGFLDFSHKFLHNNGFQNFSLVIFHVQVYFSPQKQVVGTKFLTQVSKETSDMYRHHNQHHLIGRGSW